MASDPYGTRWGVWSPSEPDPSASGESVIAAPISDYPARRRTLRKRAAGALAGLVALVTKFATAIKAGLLLVPKVKLLSTAGTALVSVAAYALFWGWTFAVGFVVLLFVHEMGHVLQLRREGIRATAPRFIPFLGAYIGARLEAGNALIEARVGLAGPILGSIGALACVGIYAATGNDLFRALAYVGFLLNLFNMLPVLPLDGGRAMAAMAPWMWFVGFALLIAAAFVFPSPVMILVLVFGGFETYRRWRARRTRNLEQAAYYRVSPRNRALIGGVYVGLLVLLALGMHATYIPRSL